VGYAAVTVPLQDGDGMQPPLIRSVAWLRRKAIEKGKMKNAKWAKKNPDLHICI
jgi:hypothetical protein